MQNNKEVRDRGKGQPQEWEGCGWSRTVFLQYLGKLSVCKPRDPAVPFLRLHTAEMHVCVHQKTRASMFMAELLIIVPNRKTSKCPTTVEWIKKLKFIHNTGKLYRSENGCST